MLFIQGTVHFTLIHIATYMYVAYNFHSACQWHVFGNTNNIHSSTTQLETILQHYFFATASISRAVLSPVTT